MRFDKVHITLQVQLHEAGMQRYLPCTPSVIGQAIAEAAERYARDNRTGYYPALDFLKEQGLIDSDLAESAEQVSWLTSKLARETIQEKLRPVFSSVQFTSVQCPAFSMPHVRPGKTDSLSRLAAHYTPDTVKLELLLTMIRRDSDARDARAEPYARKMMFRWLDAAFANVTVTASKSVDGD